MVISESAVLDDESTLLGIAQKVVEGCPGCIDVYGSVVVRADSNKKRATRHRGRFNAVGGRWEVIDLPWVRKGI